MPCHSAAGKDSCWAVPKRDKAPTIQEDLSLAKLAWYSHQYLLRTDTCREQQSICCSWLEGKATSWSRFQVKSSHELALVYWFRKNKYLQQIYQVGEGKYSLFLICKSCLSLQKICSGPGFLLQKCFSLWPEYLLDCSLVSSTVLQVQVMCVLHLAVSFVTLQWPGSSVGAWAGGMLPPGTGAAMVGAAATE